MNDSWKAFSISVMVLLVGAMLVLPSTTSAYVNGDGYGSFTQADGSVGSNTWVGDTPSCDNNYQINSHWTQQAAGQSGMILAWANRVADEGLKAPQGSSYYSLSAGQHTFAVTFYMQYRTVVDYSHLTGDQYTEAKIRAYSQVLDSYGNYIGSRQYVDVVDNIHSGGDDVGVHTDNNFARYVTLYLTVSLPTSGNYKIDCGVTAETHVKAGYTSYDHCGADLDLSPDGTSGEYCYCVITNISWV
jgi:hypothetical protein